MFSRPYLRFPASSVVLWDTKPILAPRTRSNAGYRVLVADVLSLARITLPIPFLATLSSPGQE